MKLTRRDLLKQGAGVAAVLSGSSQLFAQNAADPLALITKVIPSSGERIPIIGVGTLGDGYKQPTAESRVAIREVLRQLPMLGAKVIDTAPAYEGSEALIGEALEELGNRERIFLATKVGAQGRQAGLDMIENSFRKLRTTRLDLLAIHSLTDTATQLPTLQDLKKSGRIRYLGITTSRGGQNAELETFMKEQQLDFVQVTYAVDDRDVANTLLPLAADRGIAVMINLPFGRGRLFQKVLNTPLPDWAGEFDCRSWAQFFLKYVVSHPAVTCAIPGMSKVAHLTDNLQAGQGRLPDAAMRVRMEQYIDKL